MYASNDIPCAHAPGLHAVAEVGGDRAAAAAVDGRVASAKADGKPKAAGEKAERTGLGGLDMTGDDST